MSEKPKAVCLRGSTRFREAFEKANRDETPAGKVVLSAGMFGRQEGIDMNGPIKAMPGQLHLRKIDMADEVSVPNLGGYIGSSTQNETHYALGLGKPIRCPE